MKKIVFLSIMLLIVSGCSGDIVVPPEVNVNVEEPIADPSIISEEPNETEQPLDTYINARYGYSIDYPSEWTTGEEAHSGDGKVLYIGNPDVEISVYRSMYIEGFSSEAEEHLRTQWITLDSGKDARLLVGHEDDKYVFNLIHSADDSDEEYHFYVKVSKEFFEENEKVLLKVAKSLEVIEVEWR